ncbi:MAG: AMMECR1 domain-containing protein [Lachnospiraceae bacterium]|nr:AMMECR1 domain-containing protein [Lachnospiraceae bacterium]
MSVLSAYVLPHLQVLVPEIGQGKEEKMAATINSMKEVASRIAEAKPETIVIISSHADAYEDYFHLGKGDGAAVTFEDYGVEGVEIDMKYDLELTEEISKVSKEFGFEAGTEGEENEFVDHGTGVPLYYIDPALDYDYKIVRVSISGFSQLKHYQYGRCIKEAINRLGRKAVVIASGDMSHKLKEDGPFGYSKDGSIFDTALCSALKSANFLSLFGFQFDTIENAVECSLKSSTVLAGTLDGRFVKGDMLSYEDTYGVGCGVFAFAPSPDDTDEVEETRQFDKMLVEQIKHELSKKEAPNDYVRLARAAAEYYVFNGKQMTLEEYEGELPKEMTDKRAGVFVTINIDGLTRACMGSLSSTQNSIAEEIICSASDACHEDPRFIPIEIEELDSLGYQVDILGDFEPINALSKINAKKQGLCITLGPKTGIVLPGIEGVKDGQQQLDIAMKNSGIKPGDKYNMYRFNVKRYE